jgi:uncharacterized SAM-binding protein YcdF (DUF218 family)
MFDSTLCERSLIKVPVDNDVWAFRWLNKPLLLALLLVIAFFAIRWIFNNPERRRWFSSPKGFVLLFGLTALLALLPVAADRAMVAFLPSDPGKRVDAIVVVGRGWPLMHARVDIVAELWQAERAPKIFASGIKDAPHLVQLLKEKGIPDRAIDGENCSLTTEENAIFSAAILQPQGVKQILLVTDEPHMMRTLLAFRAYGFTVFPRISPIPEHWNNKEKGVLKLRELLGVIKYGVRGAFFERPLSDLNRPELKTLLREAEKYSQQRRMS